MRFILFILLSFCGITLIAQPSISFTFDDGDTNSYAGEEVKKWDDRLLKTFDKHNIKAAFFITGRNMASTLGQDIINSWNNKEHLICNHTYSHKNYNKTSFEDFSKDVAKNDSLISQYSNYTRLFRFPYLKEGNSAEKISKFREYLTQNNYRNGYVTIDASDWYINSRLLKRLKETPKADIQGFRDYYIAHLFERAQYYDSLAFQITGRHIKHTILLHHNLAASLFLDSLISHFKQAGWQVIDAKNAYEDEIFQKIPSIIPAGESLIWGLAKESGKFEQILRYPAEDAMYEKDKMDKLGL